MWYTTIIHPVKKHFGLTELDYCIIDTIARLSANPNASHQGWCNASNIKIAEWLCTTPKNVIAVIKKGLEKGILEVQEMGIGMAQLKRASSAWYKAIDELTPKIEPITKGYTPVTKGNTHLLPKVTPTCYQRLHPPVTKGYTDNNIDIEIDNKVDDNSILQIAEKTHAAPKKDTEQKDGILTIHDIDSTQTPDGVNQGVFYKFREWGKIRQGKAERERMTESIWGKVVDKLQKVSSQYAPQVLMEHLDTAIINKWQNPFYNGYDDALSALKAKLEAKEQTQSDEQKLAPEKEEKYTKSIEWIKRIFPTIDNTKIININRSQWLDLFDDSGATAKELKIDSSKRFEMIKNAILEVSTNGHAQNNAAFLYNHILNHINKKRYGKTNY